jgi:hypothetical protein
MDKVNWDKAIALELIQAGYTRMAKKFHPDVGGTQEQMLALTATKEHLEKLLSGGSSHYTDSFTYQRARESPPRRPRSTYRNTNRQWEQADQRTGEVPLEPYPHDNDYMQLVDVTIMSITEKAFKIKIPTVKQPQWLPKSQLHEDFFLAAGEILEGDVLTIIFSKWIAKQKGWMK